MLVLLRLSYVAAPNPHSHTQKPPKPQTWRSLVQSPHLANEMYTDPLPFNLKLIALSLRFLRLPRPSLPHTRTQLINQLASQIRRKKRNRSCQRTTNNYIRRIRPQAHCIPSRPPIIRRAKHGDIIHESMQHADLRLFGGKAVALYHGHQLGGAGYDGREGG